MKYKCESVSTICQNYVKKDSNVDLPTPKIEFSSDRFSFNKGQFTWAEYLGDFNQKIPFHKRIWKSLISRFVSQKTLDLCWKKVAKDQNLIEDYDSFRTTIQSLIDNSNNTDAGKMAEKYLIEFPTWKPTFVNGYGSEHVQFVFLKKYNEKYLPASFDHDSFKITLSTDVNLGNELHEFKLTKEGWHETRAKEAFCQVNFYYYMVYYDSNFFEKLLMSLRKTKLIAEIYIFDHNKIYSYHWAPNKYLFRNLCDDYKEETGIDLFNLFKKGAIEDDSTLHIHP